MDCIVHTDFDESCTTIDHHAARRSHLATGFFPMLMSCLQTVLFRPDTTKHLGSDTGPQPYHQHFVIAPIVLGSRCLLVWYFGQNSIDAKKIVLLNLRYSREHKCYCIERVLPRFLSDYFLIADIPTEIRRGCNVVASEQTLVLERPFTSGGPTIYLISCYICFFDESVVGCSSGLSRNPQFV